MPQKRGFTILVGNAVTVVEDSNEIDAAVFNFDRNRRCARVDGVFDKLLTTDDGLSTTSPAAIWFAICGGST